MKNKNSISRKRAHFLRFRLREAEQKQPELKYLNKMLLQLGGKHLVPPPASDGIVKLMVVCGACINRGPITLKTMEAGDCHGNVAAVWKARRFGIVAVATGFALSEDGIWRRHSWGLLPDGILETTEVRLKYVGIPLEGLGADMFVQACGESTPTVRRRRKPGAAAKSKASPASKKSVRRTGSTTGKPSVK